MQITTAMATATLQNKRLAEQHNEAAWTL